MSSLKDMNIDFVNRTLVNLEGYNGKYEVTHLINCCLGLIIFPKEKYYDQFSYAFSEYSLENFPELNQINYQGFCYIKNEKYENQNIKRVHLSTFLKRIRNGLAHANFELKGENDKITTVHIENKDDKNRTNFSIEIEISDFKKIAIFIAEQYKKIYKKLEYKSV